MRVGPDGRIDAWVIGKDDTLGDGPPEIIDAFTLVNRRAGRAAAVHEGRGCLPGRTGVTLLSSYSQQPKAAGRSADA